ncbi:MAG: agmatinase [bacterium]
MIYSHYVTFGDFPQEYKELENAKAVIFPVPLEETETYLNGTKFAPDEVILASRALEWFDETLGFEPFRKGIATISAPQWERGNILSCLSKVEDTVATLLDERKFPVVLGGEHTLTIGNINGTLRNYKDLSCLILDAHADFREDYENSKFSHACTTKRLIELGIKSIVILGVRSISREEYECIERYKNIKMIKAVDYMRDPEGSIDELLKFLTDNIFLSVDMDAFDPSLVRAVGTPEPGGFLWYNIIELLGRIFKEKDIVGCDIVELLGTEKVSSYIAAKLIYKLIAYKFFYE